MKDVLLVDDDGEMLQSLARALSPLVSPLTLLGAGNHTKAVEAAASEHPSVAVIDLCLDERTGVESGFALLTALRALDESIRVIVLTGHGSTENGVRALKLGAASFIQKPADPHHLAALVRDGAAQAELKRRYLDLERSRRNIAESALAGTSAAVTQLRERLNLAASTNQPVLLLGETGTGKGLCARLLHEQSRRSTKKLVHYHPNFGGGDLVQSELFGHIKGAFTGATESRRGLVLEADGGTLFLDELDEVPAETQVKLLDLIQEKRIRPVGADSFQTIDCRVIAASNRPIEEVLASGKLRRDLYHRIAHSVIELPPLRDRKEDIPALARNVLRQMCDDEEMNVFDLEDGAVRLLQTNPWPGNVRELQAVVQNAAYRARFKGRAAITEDDLRSVVRSPADPHPGIGTLNEQVHQFKLRLVTEALARCNGNQLQAARELGIDRGTLRRLMEK